MNQRTSKVRDGLSEARRGAKRWSAWRRRFVLPLSCVAILLALAFGLPDARGQASREYQLKAVFLFNFAQFTDWPTNTFTNSAEPLVIGILGPDPFGRTLEDTIRGENIRGHSLVIAHYRRADEIKTCDILFISQQETRRVDEIVRSLKGKPILTVADVDTPSSAGAIIRFSLQKNKIHFRVNQEAAKAADITLSSKLLRVADETPPVKAE